MNKLRITTALAITLSLIACDTNRESTSDDDAAPAEPQNAEAQPATEPEEDATVSILRSDIEQPEPPEPVIQPFEMTIGFPLGGSDLDQDAQDALSAVMASEALSQGGAIIIGGHTDAGGSDSANQRASQARAEAVRDWFVDNGVAKERIDIIAFGEQNPTQPNALPDGSPNEAGRAANRRVEVLVTLPQGDAPATEPAASD